jgi:hypothetical protein
MARHAPGLHRPFDTPRPLSGTPRRRAAPDPRDYTLILLNSPHEGVERGRLPAFSAGRDLPPPLLTELNDDLNGET